MSSKEEVKILAIESSCDETAAAVVVNGREVRSNVISSQIARIRCMAEWCRRLRRVNTLKRSIRSSHRH